MWEEMWENISENPLFIYKIQHLMRWFGTSPATTHPATDAGARFRCVAAIIIDLSHPCAIIAPVL